MPLPTPKKFLPGRLRGRDEEEEFELEEDQDEADLGNTDAGDDILRQMGIELESTPPDHILTSGAIKGVTIRTYDVGGYVLEDVHQFHERVLETVQWYGKALHQRDMDVHTLATELDRSQTDFLNQKFQLELLRGQSGKALVNEDGSYVTESQLQENPAVALQVAEAKVAELTRQNEEAQQAITTLTQNLSDFQTYADQMEERQKVLEQEIERLQGLVDAGTGEVIAEVAPTSPAAEESGLSDAERQQLEDLIKWAGEVEVEYTRMETRLAEAEAENASLKAQRPDTDEIEELRTKVAELTQRVEESKTYSDELDAYVKQLEAHIEELNEYIAQLSTDVEGEHEQGSEEESEETTDTRPSSYAPELPEGVILPSQTRRHRPSEFAPAAPGAPLTSIDPDELDKYL